MRNITENYRAVRADIDRAAIAAGRDPQEVLLLAVSKTMPAEDIRELYEAGVRDFGENRIQELELKAGSLPEDIVWHFIGPLQSNKIRKAVKFASVIHSVENISAVERLERIAGEEQLGKFNAPKLCTRCKRGAFHFNDLTALLSAVLDLFLGFAKESVCGPGDHLTVIKPVSLQCFFYSRASQRIGFDKTAGRHIVI